MNLPAQSWDTLTLDKPSAITLGNFDGIHRGHHEVLTRLIAIATEKNLTPVVLTFEPHPRHVFRPDDPCSRLTSPAEKAEGLAAYPVKVVTLRFDMDLAAIPAESFVSDFLMGQLQGQAFLLGHDHRFGANARGDADLLRRIAGPTILVETTAPFKVAGELVSSSIIRAHLEAGRLAKATALLGRPFRYTGQVVAGAGRAKTLGVPTANLDVGCKEKVRVASGVYFGEVQWDGQSHSAIANIGFAPTFGEGQHKIEVHIPGFSDNLYHQTLSFELSHRHRGEIRFADLDALKAQISKDLEAFKAHFSQITSQ